MCLPARSQHPARGLRERSANESQIQREGRDLETDPERCKCRYGELRGWTSRPQLGLKARHLWRVGGAG